MSEFVAVLLALSAFSFLIHPPDVKQTELGVGLERSGNLLLVASILALLGLTTGLIVASLNVRWIVQHRWDIYGVSTVLMLLSGQCYRLACEALMREFLAFTDLVDAVIAVKVGEKEREKGGG